MNSALRCSSESKISLFFSGLEIFYLQYSIVLILFFLLILQPPTAKAADPTYLDQLITTARQKKLHEKKYWRILLHYEKKRSGTCSRIDDPDFFLAEDGKYDPEAELYASIKTFFKAGVTETDFPVCQFIARYTWLKDELDIDPAKVGIFECDAVDQLTPTSATLIFPTYFMNNPASMFGHTLINIETSYANPLLTKSVNYAARTAETNGLFFAIKGLFGFYEGYYSVLPYYKKIQQYSDISQRDIWEYRLNLIPSEIDRMVRHIRELEGIHADYFFLDENCSYSLLYLLEAARPSVELTDKFSFFVVPVDTIREIEKAGMITKAILRPSKASKIRQKISMLTEAEKKITLDIIYGKRQPETIFNLELHPENQILILDIVAEYLSYRYVKKKIAQKTYKKTLLETLKIRSQLGKQDHPYTYSPPPRPDQMHASRKFHGGYGANTKAPFYEIGYRPAFSDLVDTDLGYNQGTQIEFCDARVRYYPTKERFSLDHLDVIDIVSISPRDAFFTPLSWKVSTGVYQEITADGEESTLYKLNTGAGVAYYYDTLGLSYLFLEPELQYGTGLEENFALGGGISMGIIKTVTHKWKLHFHGKYASFRLGDIHNTARLSLTQHFIIQKNCGIQIKLAREMVFETYTSEITLNILFYF